MDTNFKSLQKKEKSQSKFNINEILSLELSKPKLSDPKKEEFYSELGMLLEAGLDIRSSFFILTKEKNKKKLQEFYDNVNEGLIKGMSLSEALQATKLITPMEYYSIKIGEETGKISDVLNEIAQFFHQKIKWRKQIVGALSYPTMVIITALLVILFMVNFIVPLFEDVFKRFSAELPSITKAVLSFSNWMQTYYLYIFLFIALAFGFALFARKKEWYKKSMSNIVLRLPLIKDMVIKARMSRYCHAMSKMIMYYVPILTALELSSKMTTFYPLQKALEKIQLDVSKGVLLSESMKQFKIFDMKMVSLTKVGEEINQLGVIYDKLSKQYEDDFQYRIASINNILEPTLILVIGGMIALILISMYLPMFQLNNNFM